MAIAVFDQATKTLSNISEWYGINKGKLEEPHQNFLFSLSSTKDRVNRKTNSWSPSCTGRICSIQKVSERNCVSFPKPFVINIRTHARAHVGLGQVGNHSWGRRLALGQSCPGRRAERTSPDPARDSHLSRRRYLRPCAAVDARWCCPS